MGAQDSVLEPLVDISTKISISDMDKTLNKNVLILLLIIFFFFIIIINYKYYYYYNYYKSSVLKKLNLFKFNTSKMIG